MSDREELIALRRLAELEAKAGNGVASTAPEKQAVAGKIPDYNKLFQPEPVKQGAIDVMTGMTGTIRGAANLAEKGYNKLIGGEMVEPTWGEKLAPSWQANKNSGLRTLGEVIDPTAAGIAVALPATKLIGPAFKYAPILGKGFEKGAIATARNLGSGAATGAILGGLSENGTAADGAMLGAGLNAGLPLAGIGAKWIGTTARNTVQPHLMGQVGAKTAAGRLAAKVAQKSGQFDQILDALENNAGMYTETATAGQAAAKAGSAEFSALDEILNDYNSTQHSNILKRQATQRDSTLAGIGRDENVLAQAVKERGDKSRPFYASSEKQMLNTQDFNQMSKDPVIINAINKVMKDPLYGVTGKNPKSIAVMDAAKKYLDDTASTMANSGSNNAARLAGNGANNIVEIAEKASPDYAQARNIYKNMSEPVNKMNLGQQLRADLKKPLRVGERAASFSNAVENAPKTLKKSTGFDRFQRLDQVFDPTEMSAVDRVSQELVNNAELADLAKKGRASAMRVIGTSEPKVPATGILNTKISASRAAINTLQGKATNKILEDLSSLRMNPRELAVYMRKADPQKRSVIVDLLTNMARGGAVSAAARSDVGE